MPQFKVVLDGIELSDRETAHINNAIQSAVLTELANIDRDGDRASVLLEKFGGELNGLIAYPVDLGQPGLERLDELNERFA